MLFEALTAPTSLVRTPDAPRMSSKSMLNDRLDLPEEASYLSFGGAHLYTVLHRVEDPIARVLLVGPFAAERHSSYIPWVRWARFLAARQIEALRFDYRGLGESTGRFEDMSFDEWSHDVAFLASWLENRAPRARLVLHGLQLGAVLATRTFAEGAGDALLVWSPPANANEVLRAALRRRIAVDHAFNSKGERKPMAEYIRQLEAETLEVDGYQWSGRLWRDSLDYQMPSSRSHTDDTWADGRPFRAVKLDKTAVPLVRGSAYDSINPDLTELFTDNVQWITAALAARRKKG